MTHITIWTRSVLLASLLLAGALAAPRSAAAGSAQRVAILLDGYGTSSADVPVTFSTIRQDVLSRAGYAQTPVLFSYRYPGMYTATATYNALPCAAVTALHNTITDLIARRPDVQIDLIGYSLGGSVAIQYVSTYGVTAEGQHVRHVVTLDSPVNGTSHGRLVMLAAALNQQRLVGSATGRYLVAEGRDPNTHAANIALAKRLQPVTRVLTVDSHDDWLVPPGDAEIPDFSQEFRLGRDYRACLQASPSCLGHDRVLHDVRVMAALRTALASAPVTSPAR